MPPAWQCFAVALVLAVMALWPWYALGRIHEPTVLAGTYMIAGIFVARGIAGFSHRWKAHFTTEPVCHAQPEILFALLPLAGRGIHRPGGRRTGQMSLRGPLRVGVGGPVGSGKTALVERLCKRMCESYDIAVVTNDIYTKEDAEFLTRAGALAPERIVGVETGGCPHTAIREDASINLAAVSDIVRKWPDLEVIFVESGGDNLAAPSRPNWPISPST